jgi:predicted transposase YdaD
MVITIMAYQFEQLSRREIESMLDITLKETRIYREIKEEGREEGREVMARALSRQLTKRLGELPENLSSSVLGLSLPVLQELSEALLDFANLDDLQAWLAEHS